MTDVAALVSPFLDLVAAPFTFPGSRLLVLATEGGLTVRLAEYEKPLDECVVLDRVRVLDENGAALPVTLVLPDRIEFGGGAVSLTFAGVDALSIGTRDERRWTVEYRVRKGGTGVCLALAGQSNSISIPHEGVPSASSASHLSQLRESRAVWDEWLDRCPAVRPDLQAMTAYCWWVLGANIVTLPGRGGARAVVPSKIGYVGLWQWDAYFIAVGLRHGDPGLAMEQLDLAFRFPTATGQLPDVVHDTGVLASSDDLPPGDRATLRRAGSSMADPSVPVPLTKPPLAAWALRKVLERVDDPGWAAQAWQTVARSQEWWFAESDLDHDGMPEYGHPYSSGLDDSPIFDHELPVASPDLASYLVVQDEELADHFHGLGDRVLEERHRRRAAETLRLLVAMWDESAGLFRARAAGRPLEEYTAVSLLPLLTGRLPDRIATRLVRALDDPEEFAAPYGVPTVALGDVRFSPERMWRGPVWVNINALLVEGLGKSGHPARGRELAEATMRLVCHGGGPHEYFNPLTGEKASHATTSFGWSAALFIDLAVGLSE